MPPKKGKAPKPVKFPSLDNADTSVMSFEQLQQYCLQLFLAGEEERKISEKLQIERDKLLKYWSFSGDSLREALYDLRDQQLCLENDEYSMKTRMDRKVQSVRRTTADCSETIEKHLLARCSKLEKCHQAVLEKNHQVWTDVQDLKSKIVDNNILKSEAMTDLIYVKQHYLELINKNLLKQRQFDLTRIKKELRKERKKYVVDNSEHFRKECMYKEGIMKSVVNNNKCSLRKLATSFERILSYNFEKVSELKDKAESLKKLDIMLSKEYLEASKTFYRSVSSHAEGMRTLNQMRTFLYAAGKTERSLVMKKKEESLVKLQAEAYSVRHLNTEIRIVQVENKIKEITETVLSYRKIMTRMFKEDNDILSRNIEKHLMELYRQKVHLYSILQKNVKTIDFQSEVADMGDLTYRTQYLGNIDTLLRDFQEACTAVVVLFKRLFNIWNIDFKNIGVIINNHEDYPKPTIRSTCLAIKDTDMW